ncbi:MAG: indole-3-glycerol phosphate synthase TrpC [Actinomycetota bacterium]
MGFLTDIVSQVRADLRETPLDLARLRERISSIAPSLDFAGALDGPGTAVIAEVKRASPSAGTIAAEADPASRARAYADAGAACVSVLTERRHFAGSLADMDAVRTAIGLPVLRKDFLVDAGQLLEARAHGADAVLLIVACVDDGALRDLLAGAAELGLGVLLETHGDDDLERALATDARVIGVNARDLETLEVDPERARRQLALVPADRIAVLESGIRTRADVVSAVEAGASAILVGETLMRAGDPRRALRSLIGEEPET